MPPYSAASIWPKTAAARASTTASGTRISSPMGSHGNRSFRIRATMSVPPVVAPWENTSL